MSDGFDEIEQKVASIIRNVLQVKDKEITKASTIADLGGDSLSALGILAALEREFDIDISDDDAVKINSFSAAVGVVRERMNPGGSH